MSSEPRNGIMTNNKEAALSGGFFQSLIENLEREFSRDILIVVEEFRLDP